MIGVHFHHTRPTQSFTKHCHNPSLMASVYALPMPPIQSTPNWTFLAEKCWMQLRCWEYQEENLLFILQASRLHSMMKFIFLMMSLFSLACRCKSFQGIHKNLVLFHVCNMRLHDLAQHATQHGCLCCPNTCHGRGYGVCTWPGIMCVLILKESQLNRWMYFLLVVQVMTYINSTLKGYAEVRFRSRNFAPELRKSIERKIQKGCKAPSRYPRIWGHKGVCNNVASKQWARQSRAVIWSHVKCRLRRKWVASWPSTPIYWE